MPEILYNTTEGGAASSDGVRSGIWLQRQTAASAKDLEEAENAQRKLQEAVKRMHELRVIPPDSELRRTWDMIQVFLLIYVALCVPYRIGFGKDTQISLDDPWFMFDLAIDIYFICDLVLNFRTAVYTSDGTLAFTPGHIARIYLTGWFPIDFVSCLPFGYIEVIVPADENGQSGAEKKAGKL
eukprot:SAG22_NODE_4359_length_1293_cov_0.906198_2_plen_182_part_01